MNFKLKQLLREVVYRIYLVHSKISPKLNKKLFQFKEEADFPTIVHPENINICNSECVMCPYSKMTRKKGKMSWEIYTKLVEESSKQNKPVELWLYMFGEPLLDQDLEKKIRYAKEKGISKVYISTNASVLDKKRAESLLESGIDAVTISFDGVTKEVYEKLRKNLNFNTVFENTKYFLNLKKSKGYKKPEITLQIIDMNETKKELSKFIRIWKKLADKVVVIPYHDYAGQKKTVNSKNNQSKNKIPCPYLWEKAIIHCNGDLVFCCFDYNGKEKIGNIKDKSLMEIWNGPEMRAIRRAHIENRQDTLFLCNNCNAYEDIQKSFIINKYIKNTFILKRLYKFIRGEI